MVIANYKEYMKEAHSYYEFIAVLCSAVALLRVLVKKRNLFFT
jgi:hypothetical protein